MFLHPGSTFFKQKEKSQQNLQLMKQLSSSNEIHRNKEGGEKGGAEEEQKCGEKEDNGRQIWSLRGLLALCVLHRTKEKGGDGEARCFEGVKEMTGREGEVLLKASKAVLKFVVLLSNWYHLIEYSNSSLGRPTKLKITIL